MTGRPWYAFYPDAYERDAGHLSYVQDSAYRRMLDHYYKTGEPLPLDHETIYRACRAMRRDERTAIDYCLDAFFERRDDGYHQQRADDEIARASDISAKRAEAASKRHSKTHAIAEQLDTQSTTTTTATPSEANASSGSAEPSAAAPKPSRSKPRRGLPEDFPAEPEFKYARDRWLAKGRADLCEGMEDQAQRFRDHHTANATKSADWSASWRTWVGNALQFNRQPRPGTPQTGLAAPFKPLSILEKAS